MDDRSRVRASSHQQASQSLGSLLSEIRACQYCLQEPQGAPLPHVPRPIIRASSNASICIIGQAPGTRVHASGKPFTDPSGDRLRDWLQVTPELFYDEQKFAIVPMGFCFPGLDAKGGDRPPRKECAPKWQDEILSHLPQIKLKLLVGHYAQKWHLAPSCPKTLTETVRQWRDYYDQGDRASVLPLPHPSWRNNGWLKKNPFFERDVIPFLRDEVKRRLSVD